MFTEYLTKTMPTYIECIPSPAPFEPRSLPGTSIYMTRVNWIRRKNEFRGQVSRNIAESRGLSRNIEKCREIIIAKSRAISHSIAKYREISFDLVKYRQISRNLFNPVTTTTHRISLTKIHNRSLDAAQELTFTRNILNIQIATSYSQLMW